MPSKPKPKQKTFHLSMLKTEFEQLKAFLDTDDAPVYLTFKSIAYYPNNQKANAVMIETGVEKEDK